MFSIRSATHNKSTTPNILPCRINHTGPSKVSKRFWSPKTESDGTQIACFRGRELRGRKVKVPEGYQGVIVNKSDKTLLPAATKVSISFGGDDEDLEEEKQEPVKLVETAATFDEVVVWGHEALPESDDSFVKGVEEWIAFAEAIHKEPRAAE